MVLFGISGESTRMKDANLTYQQIADEMQSMGLTCFEYPFTYGTNITKDKCIEIGKIFKSCGISLSVHAPYYINLASPNEEQVQKSFVYIYESMRKAKLMGADRVVVHPGSLTKQDREVAFQNTLKNLETFVNQIEGDENVSGVFICPETMGKHGQIGTVDEVYTLCKLSDKIIPTLDFGHINAYGGGSIKSITDYYEILDKFTSIKNNIHIHFSRIEYGPKGELKHLTFDTDTQNFGPDQTQFANALKKYNANIRVISESSGCQDREAKIMLDIFKK